MKKKKSKNPFGIMKGVTYEEVPKLKNTQLGGRTTYKIGRKTMQGLIDKRLYTFECEKCPKCGGDLNVGSPDACPEYLELHNDD